VDGAFRLIEKNNPKRCFETHRDSFFVGRAPECDIIIPEDYVSRVQAKVTFENGRHFIKNLGRNALRVNSRTTAGDFLTPGDEITFGKACFLYQAAAEPAVEFNSKAKTILAADTDAADTPPDRRLVCTSPSGQATAHRLCQPKIVIGRSQEADIILNDPSVSRYHCVIEEREGACYIRNISLSNPLTINHAPATEKRLYSGDQLKIGAWSLAFISSRRDDTRQPEQPHHRHPLRRRWVFAFLFAVAAGYAAYGQVVVPWMNEHALAGIAAQIDAGEFDRARDHLLNFLEKGPSPENSAAARRLLSLAVVGVTGQKARSGSLEDAAAFLKEHLAAHGAGKEAGPVWDQLNRYRIQIGQRLEADSDYHRSLSYYSAVSEDSPFFTEAQKAIHRIWLDYQKKEHRQQTVAQLLKEAEAHFAVKRYLAPVHQNAYSVYQAVLALEPRNETALKRIEQIRAYFRTEGDVHFKAGNWPQALAYLERYTLIDPDAVDAREKIAACHRKLAEPPQSPTPSTPAIRALTPTEPNEQEKVRQLLKESGAQSSWIMKYLFDESPRASDSETPW
jgi:pSer/pThr/pTyr-binding forkhead associated (FHA) protein/tetratricopeptide (TPR) repeat protein